MSVIFFDSVELGNIGRAIVAHKGAGLFETSRRAMASRLAENLATISKANALAYADRYGPRAGDSTPYSVAEILEHIETRQPADTARAFSTAQLLHYNCIEAEDFLAQTDGGCAALANILEGVLAIALEGRA